MKDQVYTRNIVGNQTKVSVEEKREHAHFSEWISAKLAEHGNLTLNQASEETGSLWSITALLLDQLIDQFTCCSITHWMNGVYINVYRLLLDAL